MNFVDQKTYVRKGVNVGQGNGETLPERVDYGKYKKLIGEILGPDGINDTEKLNGLIRTEDNEEKIGAIQSCKALGIGVKDFVAYTILILNIEKDKKSENLSLLTYGRMFLQDNTSNDEDIILQIKEKIIRESKSAKIKLHKRIDGSIDYLKINHNTANHYKKIKKQQKHENSQKITYSTTEEGVTEEGVTEEGVTEEGVTEEGVTEEGVTEEEVTGNNKNIEFCRKIEYISLNENIGINLRGEKEIINIVIEKISSWNISFSKYINSSNENTINGDLIYIESKVQELIEIYYNFKRIYQVSSYNSIGRIIFKEFDLENIASDFDIFTEKKAMKLTQEEFQIKLKGQRSKVIKDKYDSNISNKYKLKDCDKLREEKNIHINNIKTFNGFDTVLEFYKDYFIYCLDNTTQSGGDKPSRKDILLNLGFLNNNSGDTLLGKNTISFQLNPNNKSF